MITVNRADAERVLDQWYDRYRRYGRIDQDVFLSLRNQLIPLEPGEPVQFQERGRKRWLNGTFGGPAGNPDDPQRDGDVWVAAARGRRVPVFLSHVRRRTP